MAKVFYSAGDSRRASPNESPRQPILSDSEADTDIETQQKPVGTHRKNVHRRSESEFSVEERVKQEESTSTHNYKRLRRPGSAVVRQRQSSRDVRDSTGQRHLQKACSRGDLEKVKELLEDFPDLEDRDYAGTTALHSAALTGHSGVVQALLDAGAVPDVRSGPEELDTPLMDAAANGYLSVVQQLLNAGADPRIDNAIGRRAIDFALEELELSERNDEDVTETKRRKAIVSELNSKTRELRRRGAPIIDSPNHDLAHSSLYPPGFTSVQRSPPPIFLDVLRRSVREEVIEHAATGDLPYVGLALERGWHPNAKALVNAAKYGHSEVVGLLLAFGMDSNAKYEGNTALQEAIERDHYACAKLLVDSGAVIHRSYAQYVADLPQDNELRQLVVGTMALPLSSTTRGSVDDEEPTTIPEPTTISEPTSVEPKPAESKSPKPEPEPSKQSASTHSEPTKTSDDATSSDASSIPGISAPKIDLRAIKPKKRSKSTASGISDEPKSKPNPVDDSKASDTKRAVSPSPRQSPSPDHRNSVTFKEDIVRREEEDLKNEETPGLEETEKNDVSAEASKELPIDSPRESPKPEPREDTKPKDDVKDSKVWAERSQELSQLAELKEKQRRDREAKMLASLRKQSEGSESAVASSQSPTPSPAPSNGGSRISSPAAPDQYRSSSVDAESAAVTAADTTAAAASVIAEASDGGSSPFTGEPKMPVGNLPWIVRQLAYSGKPQHVGPIYMHIIGGVSHCIDLQAGLALGEPLLQKKYDGLDNKVISLTQKELLWSFCKVWVCRPGATAAEVQKDRSAFLDLGMCWVPVPTIQEIAHKLELPLRFIPIQLYPQPISKRLPVNFSLKNSEIPLIWQYRISSERFQ